jgi:hypothetical protein
VGVGPGIGAGRSAVVVPLGIMTACSIHILRLRRT